jgi:hypothetical protein
VQAFPSLPMAQWQPFAGRDNARPGGPRTPPVGAQRLPSFDEFCADGSRPRRTKLDLVRSRQSAAALGAEAIRSALEGFADRLAGVGVEASSLGLWLYRELHAGGLLIIVVEARHMRVSLSTMRNKMVCPG